VDFAQSPSNRFSLHSSHRIYSITYVMLSANDRYDIRSGLSITYGLCSPPTRSRPPAIPPRTFQIFHLPIPTSSPPPAPERSTIDRKDFYDDKASYLIPKHAPRRSSAAHKFASNQTSRSAIPLKSNSASPRDSN
jgi:hypothetical protein